MKNFITIGKDDPCIDYIEGEQWKVLTGYQYYLVSNYGRIYSMKHHKILKQNFACNYFETRLKCDDGEFRHVKIHRLVACAFCDNPQTKPVVHHKDGNSRNNRADNLQWCTKSEHRELHRLMRGGAKNEQA